MLRLVPLLVLLATVAAGVMLAQTDKAPLCDLTSVQDQLQQALEDLAAADDADTTATLESLYQAGFALQTQAVACGYEPASEEREKLADFTLSLVDLPTLLMRNTVGGDVDSIMEKLVEIAGDPIRGQLLYNGLEDGIDGFPLGCSGCHVPDGTAPDTAGTWTRVVDIRLKDPALEGYTFERYIVESIVAPEVYLVPGYGGNLMPANFGQRLSIEQLADLVVYLSSQDQEID